MKAVAKALESRFRQALDAGRLSQVHYMFNCKSSQYMIVVSCVSVGIHVMHKVYTYVNWNRCYFPT